MYMHDTIPYIQGKLDHKIVDLRIHTNVRNPGFKLQGSSQKQRAVYIPRVSQKKVSVFDLK